MIDELKFMNRGLDYLACASDIRVALTNLVRSAVESVGSNSGSLFLLNQQAGVLEPYILVNFDPEYLKGCSTVALGSQCCGRAALHKLPWIVSDMLTDPLFLDCAEAAAGSGFRSGFSIPVLFADGECIGTLGCQFRTPHTPSKTDLRMGELFAQLIAVAVQRERSRAQDEVTKRPAVRENTSTTLSGEGSEPKRRSACG